MNVKKVCSCDASASHDFAVLAAWWLCARMLTRVYLALHPRRGCSPVRIAIPLRFAFLCYMSRCPVHLQCFAVSIFLQASRICASAPVFHAVIHSWSAFIHSFSTDSPTPLLNNPLPRGYVWNAYFSRFTCPLLRNVFNIAKQRNRFCPAE